MQPVCLMYGGCCIRIGHCLPFSRNARLNAFLDDVCIASSRECVGLSGLHSCFLFHPSWRFGCTQYRYYLPHLHREYQPVRILLYCSDKIFVFLRYNAFARLFAPAVLISCIVRNYLTEPCRSTPTLLTELTRTANVGLLSLLSPQI